jgi:hypothetical protein
MSIQKADGTVLTKITLQALTTEVPSTKVTLDEDIYHTYNYGPYDGTQPQIGNRFATFEGERALLFKAGQVVEQAEIDALFPVATASSISPATGPAAGGTAVVITGTNLSGATGVTFGGTAGTAFAVLGQHQVRVTTPAKTAGVVTVVVKDDAGDLTMTGAYTYV